MLSWENLKKYSQRAGREVMALTEAAYRTAKDSGISWRHKSLLLGSLVYLITPVDALPDFLPGGFSDDLSLMLGAVLATGQVGKKHLQQCRLKYGLTEENEDHESFKTPPPQS